MPPRQQRRAQDGEVHGPSSALTSFLREQGISAESVQRRYEENVRREQEMIERANQAEGSSEEPAERATLEPIGELSSDEEVYEGEEEEVRMRELARRKRRRMDGDGDGEGAGANADYDNDEDEVGKNHCLECDKSFAISVYSKKMERYGRVGYLCPSCTKIALRRERLAKRNELEARKKRKKMAAALLDKQQYRLPSLQDMCIKLITDNIGDVDLLGDIGTKNRKKISRILAKKRSLDNRTMQLFLDPGLKSLEFWDCSKIDRESLNMIASVCPHIESLTLNMCGHLHKDNIKYFTDKLDSLQHIDLNGPFLINDQIWQEFLESSIGQNLKGFKLKNTHRFTSDSLVSLLESCGRNLEVLSLSRLDGLDSKAVYDMLPVYLQNVKHLEISSPHKPDLIDDDMIVNLLANCGENLESLVLDGCSDLTDQFLISGVKPFCPNLTKLSLKLVNKITDNGVLQLFTDWDINGGLMELYLDRCNRLTDKSVYKALEHSSQTLVQLSLNSVKDLTKKLFLKLSRNQRFPLLTTLDLGFVPATDDSILAIWSRIAPKLTVLEVYGDSRCTSKAIIREDLNVIGRQTDSI